MSLDMVDASEIARDNLKSLSENSYPGRGFVIGRDRKGDIIQAYWLTGRSEDSRNRCLTRYRRRLAVEVADQSKVHKEADLSLRLYNAMDEVTDETGTEHFIVSNGCQTDTVAKIVRRLNGELHDKDRVSVAGQFLAITTSFLDAMVIYSYEPDPPHHTPRIAAIYSIDYAGNPIGATMAIVRKAVYGCDRSFYTLNWIPPGFGFCLTTYAGDGNPLPAFREEPFLLPLVGGVDEIAHTFWDALNEQNRVSLAVKRIISVSVSSDVAIINKYPKVVVTTPVSAAAV